MNYEDYRDQMHPKVAMAVPSTPEATAILQGESVKPTAFGGLVTKLVELGVVEPTSMDIIRTSVSELLGIENVEFDKRLADINVIHHYTVSDWIENYQSRGVDNLIEAKFVTVKTYFDEIAVDLVGDTHLDKLKSRITEAAAKVAEIEAKITEFETNGPSYRVITYNEILRRGAKPELEALETSRYAISLTEFTEMLKTDPLITEHGEEFARKVINGFGGVLKDKAHILPEYWWIDRLISGEREDLHDEDLDSLKNIWLSETDVSLLAQSYAITYYSHLGRDTPGKAEMEALPNPIRDAMYVSEEERTAFFIAYPLANGYKPRY